MQKKGNLYPLVSIIVPVYNEKRTILQVLKKLYSIKKRIPIQIIVVDDSSTDGTGEILKLNKGMYDSLICLDSNQGKGAAVRSGLEFAVGAYVLVQDADLEYDPMEIPRLLEICVLNEVDLLATTRIVGGNVTRVHYFWHKVGNRLITFIFNLLFNTTFTDIFSGYIIFKKSLIDAKSLKYNKWGQQIEILALIAKKNNLKIFESSINYYGRTYAEGKKISVTAIIPVLLSILACRFR